MHRHLTIALLALLVAAAPAHAAVTATRPTLVTGTDGRRHLVYELISTERLSRLDVVSGNDTIATYRGEALKTITFDGFTMLDIPLRRAARVPAYVEHRVSGRRTARVRVDRRAPIRISPPLRGPNLGVLGCCGVPFGHRLAALERRGRPTFPQRYAIDFLRLDDSINTYTGDPANNASYFIYGSEVIAVAPGRIVATRGDIRENTPPGLPPNVAFDDLPGNFVNQDLGARRFALYAHLQPGSVRVKAGDVIRPGQVLGRVGNSGNSSEPHLHFHVVDAAGGPSNLVADGLPYVFDRFRLDSRVTGLEQIPTRVPARPPAERTGELPLTGDVITLSG